MKRIFLGRWATLSVCAISLVTIAITNNHQLNAQKKVNTSFMQYLDDRSDPVQLLKSYYNAINRHEYVRAYYYWSPQNATSATSQPPSYPQFEAGYAKTTAVQLTTGKVTGEGAAGSFYSQVPVTLVATHTDASKHIYVGCYTIKQVNASNFGAPPFIPMRIYSAKIKEVPSKANTAILMQQSCN